MDRAFWEQAAAPWLAHEAVLDAMFAEVTAGVLARAGLQAGARVLDIGCGTGALALSAMAAGAEVTGIDVSPPLAERARARGVAVEIADAGTADLPAADAVLSRFGVMFFADPVAGFANLRRALRPGGRLSAAIWHRQAGEEYFSIPRQIADRLIGTQPPPPPGSPGPFQLSDLDRTREILAEAGFRDVSAEPAILWMPVPGGLDTVAAMLTEMGPIASRLRDHPAAELGAIRTALRAAFAPMTEGGVTRIAGTVAYLTARA